MTTLTIKDLAHTETLDRQSLAAVQGGMMKGGPAYWPGYYDLSSHDNSLNATQLIGQSQEVSNVNGNNVFGVDGIRSTVKPRQEASNSIFRL